MPLKNMMFLLFYVIKTTFKSPLAVFAIFGRLAVHDHAKGLMNELLGFF
nr:MAG TPA: hypothetical protein [Caudoviricetes sp.]